MRRHPLRPVATLLLVLAGGVVGFLVLGTAASWLRSADHGFAAASTTALWALAGAGLGAVLGFAASRRLEGRRLAGTVVLTTLLALLGGVAARSRLDDRLAARAAADPMATIVSPARVDMGPPPIPHRDSIIGLAPLHGSGWPGALRPPLILMGRDTLTGHIATQSVMADALEQAELGYEVPALVVRGMRKGWLLVATTAGDRGWVRAPHDSSVVPLAALLPRSLTSLTLSWRREVADSPGGAATRVAGIDPGEDETPAAVHEARLVDGTLWLDVSVFAYSPCEGDSNPPRIARGWVPAWTGGAPTAWYYSRGC